MDNSSSRTTKSDHFHIRSISLPCRSHPSIARIEEELKNKFVNTWDISSPPTAKTIKNCLSRLEDLYKGTEDLLSSPHTQEALSSHRQKWAVDDLQDGLISLLDVCGKARDVMAHIKERSRDLQSVLRRRRKGDSSVERSIADYTSFRKKIKKEAKKLIVTAKRMERKIEANPPLELDHDLEICLVIKVLRVVGVVRVSILRSLLLFVSVSKPKSTRRPLLSKWFHRGTVVCEKCQKEKVNELVSVDDALQDICGSDSLGEGDKLQVAQSRLKSLEGSIEDAENVLESLFRRFIEVRVALLNIVSH